MLPNSLFVNGDRWKPYSNQDLPQKPIMFHASWTTDYYDKIPKFLVAGQWHFPRCRHYAPELLPMFNYTKKFYSYKRNFRSMTDYHHAEEYVISQIFKPNWASKEDLALLDRLGSQLQLKKYKEQQRRDEMARKGKR